MYTNQYKFKYLEWHSSEEIHETTLKWQSGLDFIKTESVFLNELLSENTFKLLEQSDLPSVKHLIKELEAKKDDIPRLKALIIEHRNALEVLIDGIDEPVKERAFKDRHLLLELKMEDYLTSYRKIKEAIYTEMRKVLKSAKQKHLLK